MDYQLDDDLMGESYEQNQRENNYVQLPFDAPLLSWRQGNPDAEAQSSKWYGRWSINIEDWDKMLEKKELPAPKEFETHPKKDKNYVPIPGEFYRIYTWRHLIFSTICSRTRWVNGKSTTHTLVYLAEKKDAELQPLFPAILSAKAWTANHVLKNIDKWMTHVVELGIPLPPHYFYMAMGTFGKESHFSGSHGKETYPTLFIHKTPAADQLEFVGNEIARVMAEMKVNALDWMNDPEWLEPTEKADRKPAASKPYNAGVPAADDPDEEIPF